MTIIDTLITDRGAADSERARELAARGWAAMTAEEQAFYLSADNKGTYKALDMNRVAEAVAYIASRLRAAGYAVDTEPKTDWTDADIPTPAQLREYLANVEALRHVLRAELPAIPADMDDGLTPEEANSIESVLVRAEGYINNLLAAFRHCGVTVCGLGGLII